MTIQCDADWEWASNSLNQNPCVVAGVLEAACRDLDSYELEPLNNSNYPTPQKGSALPCECNTVMYSLFMACTDCQGEQIQTWNDWALGCDNVSTGWYPLDIPSDTAIPHWAYRNIDSDEWSRNDSRADSSDPDTVGAMPSSTGDTGTQTSSLLPTNTSSNSSGPRRNVGAIAGGIVGGLVTLGVLVWYIMKRKHSNVPYPSDFVNRPKTPESPRKFNYEPPPFPPAPLAPPQMVNNPSHPSILHITPHDPSFGATAARPQTLYHPRSMTSVQYNGTPEV